MLAIRNFLRTAPQITRNVVQQRNMSAIAIPARNKVSKGEKIILAGLMVLGWTAIPIWVLLNMQKYRNHQ